MIFDDSFVNLVTKTEQDAEGSPGDDGVGEKGMDVIAREVHSRVGKPRRHQEFFHGEVRKLDDR